MAGYRNAGQIRVGVVGYGGKYNMGRQHLREAAAAGMTPAAVVEIDPARLETASADFPGIATYPSISQMLRSQDVNLVILITPHNTHAPLALRCLEADRHVVCEKPFAITTAECDRMIRVAQKRGLTLSTYHNRHWDGCILRALKQIKQRHILGDIYRIDCIAGRHGIPGPTWRSSQSVSGGILYDWGVHLLEYALQVVDSDIVEVAGFAHHGHWAPKLPKSHPFRDNLNADDAAAVVRFANGVQLHLRISNLLVDPSGPRVIFTGTKGSYNMTLREWTTRIAGRKAIAEKAGENPPSQGHRFYKNIAAHLVKGEPLIITPQWARRPIHILDLAHRSAKRNKTLKAKYA